MYGSDRNCNAVFRWTISCSNLEIFAIKSQNGVVENYVFGEKDTQNQTHTFYAPKGTHQVGKFGAIPPPGPDDISQSTPDFWPIFEFQALKNCRRQTHPHWGVH